MIMQMIGLIFFLSCIIIKKLIALNFKKFTSIVFFLFQSFTRWCTDKCWWYDYILMVLRKLFVSSFDENDLCKLYLYRLTIKRDFVLW